MFKLLIDQYTQGRDTSLLNQITDFVTAEGVLQGVPNPSGDVGEPKFEVSSRYTPVEFKLTLAR